MARPAPKPRGNFKSADFYAAFAKTLRNAPPPTPAAAAVATNTASEKGTAPAAVVGGTHVYPSPAHVTPASSLAAPASTASRQSGDGVKTAAATRSVPVDTHVPKPVSAPPPAPEPARIEPKPTPVAAAPAASTAHLDAEIANLREQLRRKDDDLARARAESSRRAAELEELKTAKTELERERNNLYKRVAVVEKKLERGTHHKDGQKRHDRSQIAVAVRSPAALAPR